jgi:riboflavin kinase/FMN adenylyltransferase
MKIPLYLPNAFQVIRDGAVVPAALKRGVVAIGNFDGVHRGHRAVLDAAKTRAKKNNAAALALTFEPHPRTFFKPDAPVFRITPENAKLRIFATNNLDGAVVMQFNKELASLTAEEFVSKILVGWLGISGVVVGHDFHFGKQRQGTPEFLIEAGKHNGFAVEIVSPLNDGGVPVSSGKIRDALEAGDVARAKELLGHSWFAIGEVIHGEKRGRDLGFPTANLRLDPACALKHGIYAVRVILGGKPLDGVASFGRRPTFDNGAPLLEVFLFDFAGDLYGQSIDVAFIAWLRPEQRFESVDALVAQMNRDSEQARAALGRAGATALPVPA